MLNVLLMLPAAVHLKAQFSNLELQADDFSRRRFAWSQSPQNSDIKGSRYLTDGARESKEKKECAVRFLESPERIRAEQATEG